MLSDAWLGDSAGIFALGRVVNWQESADDAPADPVDANYVINCNDSAPGPNAEQLRAEVRRLLREAPLFGPHTAGALLSCVSWQPRREEGKEDGEEGEEEAEKEAEKPKEAEEKAKAFFALPEEVKRNYQLAGKGGVIKRITERTSRESSGTKRNGPRSPSAPSATRGGPW